MFYYNVIPFSIWFQTFGIVARLAFRRWRQFRDRYFAEKWYVILSLSTKVTVFWLNYSTYRGISEDNGWAPRTPGVNWNVVRWLASYLPLAGVLLAAGADAVAWGRRSSCEFAARDPREQLGAEDAPWGEDVIARVQLALDL